MHLPDGVLPASAWAPLWMTSVSVIFVAVRRSRSRRQEPERSPARAGFLAAVVLLLQALNFPIVGAASAHLTGTVFLAATAGLESALLAMAAVLLVQSLLFHDGGVLALGANYLNIVALPAGTLVLVRALRGTPRRSRRRDAIEAGIAATLGCLAGAASCTALLVTSHVAPWRIALPWMLGCHALVALIEGVLTTSTLLALPGQLDGGRSEPSGDSATNRDGRVQRGIVPILALAVAAAMLVPLASHRPDVLETLLASVHRFTR